MVERQAVPVRKQRFAHVPDDGTKLKMLHFMKLVREVEDRIERKLYRQGKIVGGVYVGRGQEGARSGKWPRVGPQATDVVSCW